MTSKWWGRVAIVAAVMVPPFFIVFCGFLHESYEMGGRFHCPPCDLLFNHTSGFEMHILPPWFLLPSYSMLRSVTVDFGSLLTAKVLGMVVAVGAFFAPFSLCFFDWNKVPQRAWQSLWAAVPIILGLGWTGSQMPYELVVQIGGPVLTLLYFLLLLVVFPILSNWPRKSDLVLKS